MDKEGNKVNGVNELNKKMNFENLKENQRSFKQESEEYSGKEVEITFKLDYEGELNGNEFSDTFKEGQDFEFVRYKLSQVINVNQELIQLYHKNQEIIPIYSICDIGLEKNDVIIIKISSNN